MMTRCEAASFIVLNPMDALNTFAVNMRQVLLATWCLFVGYNQCNCVLLNRL
jgi:hypothetical protein